MLAKPRYAVDQADYPEYEVWAQIVDEDTTTDGTKWYALKFILKPGEKPLFGNLAPQWFTEDEIIKLDDINKMPEIAE